MANRKAGNEAGEGPLTIDDYRDVAEWRRNKTVEVLGRLAAVEAERDAWQRYALHLCHCAWCGAHSVHCADGQRLRDIVFEGEAP